MRAFYTWVYTCIWLARRHATRDMVCLQTGAVSAFDWRIQSCDYSPCDLSLRKFPKFYGTTVKWAIGEKINRIHQNKQFYTKHFLGVDPLTPLPTLTSSKNLFWKGGAWKKVTPTNIPIPAPEYTRNSFMFLKLGCFSIYEVNE